MSVSLIIITALLLDLIFGEPRRWHPLVGFGNFASWIEKRLNSTFIQNHFLSYLIGLVAWVSVVMPLVSLTWFLEQLTLPEPFLNSPWLQMDVLVAVVCLTFAIGTKSLLQHARVVAEAMNQSDIELARKRIGMIVSRDTRNSDEEAINRATIESVLENGSDAIFAAIFWFVILGAPGVILYRLANTLDAMWGYRTERFNSFGWAAARIDDVLNWAPARLTALSYAITGNTLSALSCWKKQAKGWHGINPGVVMATGAGALNITLGGTASYHGKAVTRPELGCHMPPQVDDIERANKLIIKSIIIWVMIIMLGDYFID